jgi:hypothetical protein
MPPGETDPHRIPQWTVEYGRGIGRRRAIFEDARSAWANASIEADTDYPSMVYTPDGQAYAVVKCSPHVEVVTQRRFQPLLPY